MSARRRDRKRKRRTHGHLDSKQLQDTALLGAELLALLAEHSLLAQGRNALDEERVEAELAKLRVH